MLDVIVAEFNSVYAMTISPTFDVIFGKHKVSFISFMAICDIAIRIDLSDPGSYVTLNYVFISVQFHLFQFLNVYNFPWENRDNWNSNHMVTVTSCL